MPWYHSNYKLDDTKNWIADSIQTWQQKTAFRCVIYSTATGNILGAVGIERIQWRHKVAELGYWVASDAANQGAATTAAKLAVKSSFEKHRLNRIEILIDLENHASNRVAQKMGAVFEGTLRNKVVVAGQSCPINCYYLISTDIGL